MHLYVAVAAYHNCMTLAYISRLTDFGFATVFKAKHLVLTDTFETREFVRGLIAYTIQCSSCSASMQPPMSLTFIHGPVILPYIFNTV